MARNFARRDPVSPGYASSHDYAAFFAPHSDDRGEFFNPWNRRDPPLTRDLLKWQLSSNPWKREKKLERPISPDPAGIEAFKQSTADLRVLWMGHASFLVGIGERNVLFDPVCGKLGPFISRWAPEPFPLAELPAIDAVFLTHGHYDHFDVPTLDRVARANPDAEFFVPVGHEQNLPKSCTKVHRFDWWDRAEWAGIEVVFVPMQHWHRRGLRDYNKALWGAWRVGERVFHCGDTGYCDVFGLLGELFAFDIALMPVGAFEPRWFMKQQHMNPQESMRAFGELGASRFVAMHWGTYDLTDEPLNLGAERIVALAAEEGRARDVFVPPPGGLLEF